MSAYNFNPDLCLEVFHGIAEKIALGVSRNELSAICPKIKYTQEIQGFIKNTIVTFLKKSIDWFWTSYDIPTKLTHLRKLEEQSPKSDAWRPTTGKVDRNPIIAKSLLIRKAELIEKIELLREESAGITRFLKGFSEQIKEQLDEIRLTQEKM